MNPVLYQIAKNDLGLHETLNNTIPPEVGCAQAWSAVAKAANIQDIPEEGFNNVYQIDQFCASSPVFELIPHPEVGVTIVALSTPLHHGHVGIVAKYNLEYDDDWGIISNDSTSGTLREQWSYKSWLAHYQIERGLVVHLYQLKES